MATQYDSRHLGVTDKRYAFQGAPRACIDVLFCGRVIATVKTPGEAVDEAIAHSLDRLQPRARGVMAACMSGQAVRA